MKEPQITWHVVELDDTIVPYEEYYAGSYRPNESLEIKLQVWNNRWGTENVADAINCRIAVFFDTIEDAALLKLCETKVDDDDFKALSFEDNKGYIILGKDLYGDSNDGSETSINNYSRIIIRFNSIPAGLKNNLKNLFLNPEFDSRERGA